MKSNREKMLAPRDALMRLLEGLSGYPIIYLQAPAGYGKTVSAGLWLARQAVSSATVTLDEYDNDSANFCRKLCGGLLALQPDNQMLREYGLHPAFDSAPEEFAVRAAASLPPGSEGCLVLDDLHFVENPDRLKLLPIFLKRLPGRIRIMILSRTRPPDSFSELVLKDMLALVTSERLRFSSDEIFLLYRDAGHRITKKQAEQILALTEGWPIGLNALLLSGSAVPEKKLLHGKLESFVRTQVWDRWDEDTRAFLLKTALEEELTPSLCAALTGAENCGEILEGFARGNSFLWKSGDAVYRFHSLFREFLLHQMAEQGPAFAAEQWLRAGRWHQGQREYYKAMDCYIKCEDEEGILGCIDALVTSGDRFVIEKMLTIIQTPVVASLIEKTPALLWANAWASYLMGRPEEMADCLGRYYSRLPEILAGGPRENANLYYLKSIDYRTGMSDIVAQLAGLPGAAIPPDFHAAAGAITQNMPLFHRSFRDFSEYAGEGSAERVHLLKEALGDLLGEEQDMFQRCLMAGLHYERGELTEAHSLALSALSELRDRFDAESKFCVMILLVHILRARWQYDRAQLMLTQVEEMIEGDKAFYLAYNLDAYLFRCKLENGEVSAAQQWIEKYEPDPFEPVTFYRLYGHFTTARAYITAGSYDKAIVVLKKILILAESYRRPLDVIEAHVLLAVAFWKKRRGHQKEAMAHLEEAILLAHPYGYTQVFANEGAELVNMLYRIQNRAIRQNYTGKVPGSFSKRLHMLAIGHAKHARGLTGGRPAEPVSYTAQQKRVMTLLCEGNSYRQIAEEMGIKFSTVRSHIELIYKKLDVPNETEAVLKIKELGILEDG